jgi:hypothetical protein
MARLYLFAEGQTEQTFASIVLQPHLAKFNLFMQNPVLIAHARKKGLVHRGGGRKYLPMKNDIVRFLKQDARSDVFFTTMIDLYALHADFPARVNAEALLHDPYRRVEFLERSWGEDIGDPRFIPYIQLHEYEAYLFTDVTGFELFYPDNNSEIANLRAIADSVKTPELIDQGQHSAPSKRIIDQLPDYAGAKQAVGPQIADLIGLSAIRAKCPHFNEWLLRLEQLGRM